MLTDKNRNYLWTYIRASLGAQMVKSLSAMQETWARSLSQEDPLENGMATHSSILAWRITWAEEPGRLQSMGHKELDITEKPTSWPYISFRSSETKKRKNRYAKLNRGR